MVQAGRVKVRNAVEPAAASVTTIDVACPAVSVAGTLMFSSAVVWPLFVSRIVLAWPAGTVRYDDGVVRPIAVATGVPIDPVAGGLT